MERYKLIAIEERMRKLAGNCKRGEYGIDADLIEPGIASWYAEHQNQLPVSVIDHPVIRKWSGTFLALYRDGNELDNDQAESFLEEFLPRLV